MAAGSARLAEAHRLAQHRLGIRTVQVWVQVFEALSMTNVDGTADRFMSAAAPVVAELHRQSAGLAADYMVAARALDIPGSFLTPIRAVPSLEQILTSLWVTGPVAAKSLTGAGVPLGRLRSSVFSSSSGAAMRLALQAGRDTVIGTVVADPQGLGWARTSSGSPCAFCAMLISRGPVYSEETVAFRSHGRCSCGAQPVYGRDDGWTDQARRYRALWDETTGGRSGRAALNAFRHSLPEPRAA